jgi:hypothetical protein
MFWFQALRSRRFQRGFRRVNLHRPTLSMFFSTKCVGVCVPKSQDCGVDIMSMMGATSTVGQGLTLVLSSAQLKRILWDRGAFGGYLGGV